MILNKLMSLINNEFDGFRYNRTVIYAKREIIAIIEDLMRLIIEWITFLFSLFSFPFFFFFFSSWHSLTMHLIDDTIV
jgi:hypothetical protein